MKNSFVEHPIKVKWMSEERLNESRIRTTARIQTIVSDIKGTVKSLRFCLGVIGIEIKSKRGKKIPVVSHPSTNSEAPCEK
jgi:hypothetical protein